jgi:restriction system protein
MGHGARHARQGQGISLRAQRPMRVPSTMTELSRFPFIAGVAKAFAGRLAFLHRSSQTLAQAALRTKFDTRKWNPELLRQLEWRRFEELCVAYYQALGFTTKIEGVGGDGGVDIALLADGSEQASSLARCKAWDAYRVGVKSVKELRASANAARTPDAVLLTSGRFTQEALDLAAKEKIEMIDGAGLLEKIAALPPEKSAALLKFATNGDFLTPTCPRCSIKMTSRKSTKGGRPFWGCTNYPRCKQTIFVSAPG